MIMPEIKIESRPVSLKGLIGIKCEKIFYKKIIDTLNNYQIYPGICNIQNINSDRSSYLDIHMKPIVVQYTIIITSHVYNFH
jgi:hypothetical protein